MVRPYLSRFLAGGDVFCTAEPTRITTVLGSCVSVCLWDPVQRIGGMNHFVLPAAPPGAALAPTRYGDTATLLLLERLAALGAGRRSLRAKLFGGAAVLRGATPAGSVGRQNIEAALAMMAQAAIPVVARHLGGICGVTVRFDTDTGASWVRETAPAVTPPRRDAAPAGR